MCPTFDKAEQGLDLLQEAITNCGLTAGEDFFIGLNCAGPEMFDYEKGKYEVMVGIAKVADDLVEFWSDLLTRYPSIIAIIDPMRKQEEEHWMRLCDRISDRCLVIGSQTYHRPGLLKDKQLTENFKSSGIAFKLDKSLK
ncbi:enolase 4-like [Mytilus edulis]|uniref:enolase 4-like n=1 Tax=Mytilus edulis TaxID=6550 RepID=UPI0039EE5993